MDKQVKALSFEGANVKPPPKINIPINYRRKPAGAITFPIPIWNVFRFIIHQLHKT